MIPLIQIQRGDEITVVQSPSTPASIVEIATAGKANVEIASPSPVAVSIAGIVMQGPKGDKGDSADAFYMHDQMIAASTWTVSHNLGKFPSVTIVTSAGDEVIGDVHYVNNNTVQITFSASFAGKAYLN